MNLLKLGVGNAKLTQQVAVFDLVAGWSCPFAKDCAEKVDRITGKLIPNPNSKFRCFAAVSELISPDARKKRWYNFDLIKSCKTEKSIAELIINSLNANKKAKQAPYVRIHSSGDFFSQKYFNAWIIVANAMPEKTFYAYTKSLKFWVNRLGEIPANFRLNASKGGKTDDLIEKYNLKNVEVVFSIEEAKTKGLEIDHDDSLAISSEVKKFALLIHGGQLAGSEASKAVQKLKKEGIFGYNRGHVGEGRKTA